MNAVKKFLKDEEGVTAIEYGLIAALIAVAIVTTVQGVATNLNGVFQYISDQLGAAIA